LLCSFFDLSIMRAFTLIALALFAAVALGEEGLPEFVPCSFHAEFHTRVLNPDHDVVATSIDNVYYDHDDLWRWDSNFSGFAGILEGHEWSIIWRPKLFASYHDYGDKCLTNDGGKTIAPFPYEWLLMHTNGMNWYRMSGTWEGMPVYYYHTQFYIKNYDTNVTTDVFLLQDGDTLLFINGTAKSVKYMFDLTYAMDAISYEHNVPLDPKLFVPSARCAKGSVINVPDDASDSFKEECYNMKPSGSAASHAVLSAAAVLLLALAVLF